MLPRWVGHVSEWTRPELKSGMFQEMSGESDEELTQSEVSLKGLE